MSKVILDDTLRGKLNGLNEPLEICDETGRTVGQFLPQHVYQKLLYASVVTPYSEEEMERRRREKGGRPLSEIWKRLEQS